MNHPRLYISLYFVFLLALAPFNLLSFDTYYYWDWSRHLALSYYDGSPMIAYFIKLSTLVFGETLFALSLVGIVVMAFTTWITYKSARFFLSTKASYVAASLWLFSPLTTLALLKQTTYDAPLVLFWSLTVYGVIKFIKSNVLDELYLVGCFLGLMLLSKYSGIVLMLALFIFLLISRYRYLFKTYQFYLSLLFALIFFSPVMIWNYQHQWVSFLYQLTTHELNKNVNPLFNVVYSFFTVFLPALNIMLFPPVYAGIYLLRKNRSKNPSITATHVSVIWLCTIICITFLCFYLFTASKAVLREYWLTPYLLTAALLGGFCYEQIGPKKIIYFIIALYGLLSASILANNTHYFSLFPSKKLGYYHLLQYMNHNYPDLPETVLSAGWFEARGLFFLKNKPAIYTIDCGSPQNQYLFWSSDIHQRIRDKTLNNALYIDTTDQKDCLKKYFDTCERLFTPSYPYKKSEINLYAYRCQITN